ncbi:WD40/YVTN/BNR-like repeat-containing protein, partial [candidate division KSB1 bacterium]
HLIQTEKDKIMNTGKKGIKLCILFSLVLLTAVSGMSYSQTADPSMIKDFKWREIGPANMGGRISDIEALENNPKIIYAAAATGGLWKSVNAGTTWEPIFDDNPIISIGDIAVCQQDPDIIYVGTGEANGRNSSPWGGGVYKSEDAGQTWKFTGLKDTHHIGRILIDPKNKNVVYVAALGHLWGENEERGLYKTTNGGKNWEKILYIDEKTGVTDIAMDPKDNKLIYAASYQKKRDAFSGGDPIVRWGPGSGIWRSEDAGKNWEKITKGLPEDVEFGRIGLSAARNKSGTVYAIIETDFSIPGQNAYRPMREEDMTKEQKDMRKKSDGGIFKSTNEGKSWKRMSHYNNRPFYYSQIRVDPNDEDVLWMGGMNLGYSDDGGKTVDTEIGGMAHVDYHALWIDPTDSDHVINGCDGGINITYDRGKTWDVGTQIGLAQFYAITADMQKPYYVYGGLQDNGSWGGPSKTRSTYGIRNQNWFVLGGGDGFFCQVDPTDHNIVYSESQNGGIRRLDLRTGESANIRPDNPPLDPENPRAGRKYRFEWNSPILISTHNPKTIYFGGNSLFKSVNRGDDWEAISPDLTAFPEERYSAIVSVDESPINPGLIWTGTNDGNVWMTRNDGISWEKLNGNIPGAPQNYWVKRLEASNHEPGRAYLVYDGHRNDDMDPYVFMTDDFGATWTNITNNLPYGSVFVVREDYNNPNLLFAGTAYGVYISLDRGKNWTEFSNGLPTVEVHDLYIHPRDGDLIAGTHGRGAWIADNITPLQQVDNEVLETGAHLFESRPEIKLAGIYEWQFLTSKVFKKDNPENGVTISYYLKDMQSDSVEIEILDITGKVIRNIKGSHDSGINKVLWNFQHNPPPSRQSDQSAQQQRSRRRRPEIAVPGVYLAKVSLNGGEYKITLTVEKDNPGYMGKR